MLLGTDSIYNATHWLAETEYIGLLGAVPAAILAEGTRHVVCHTTNPRLRLQGVPLTLANPDVIGFTALVGYKGLP